jgi:hypothetical protein
MYMPPSSLPPPLAGGAAKEEGGRSRNLTDDFQWEWGGERREMKK